MAYIEITDAMVDAGHNAAPGVPKAVIRHILGNAFVAAEIRTEPAPVAPLTHITVWFNGDESICCPIDGPPTDYVADVKTVQVSRYANLGPRQ